jgi:hypothetical protein
MGIHRFLEAFDGLSHGLSHFRDALGAKNKNTITAMMSSSGTPRPNMEAS